jgi:hypothetical protein
MASNLESLIRNNIANWNAVAHFPENWLIVIAFLDPGIPRLFDSAGNLDKAPTTTTMIRTLTRRK